MTEAIEWVKANWVQIGVVILALHTLLKAVADVTATKKDDALVAKLGAIIGYLFGGKRPS